MKLMRTCIADMPCMGLSLNLTCDIRLFKNRHGNSNNTDKVHCLFLKATATLGTPGQNFISGGIMKGYWILRKERGSMYLS